MKDQGGRLLLARVVKEGTGQALASDVFTTQRLGRILCAIIGDAYRQVELVNEKDVLIELSVDVTVEEVVPGLNGSHEQEGNQIQISCAVVGRMKF